MKTEFVDEQTKITCIYYLVYYKGLIEFIEDR
jgi:hypothetical protein